jgi:hypothetical protein
MFSKQGARRNFIQEVPNLVVLEIDVARASLLLFIAVLFLSGLQIVPMGVIGEYTGCIYVEAEQRPLHIGREVVRSASGNPNSDPGFDSATHSL